MEFAVSGINSLIQWYCRDAGVRSLQQHIEKVLRKVSHRLVLDQEGALDSLASDPWKKRQAKDKDVEDFANYRRVTDRNLELFLGKPPFSDDR